MAESLAEQEFDCTCREGCDRRCLVEVFDDGVDFSIRYGRYSQTAHFNKNDTRELMSFLHRFIRVKG